MVVHGQPVLLPADVGEAAQALVFPGWAVDGAPGVTGGVVEDQAEVAQHPHHGHQPGGLQVGITVQAVHVDLVDRVEDQDKMLQQDEKLEERLREGSVVLMNIVARLAPVPRGPDVDEGAGHPVDEESQPEPGAPDQGLQVTLG